MTTPSRPLFSAGAVAAASLLLAPPVFGQSRTSAAPWSLQASQGAEIPSQFSAPVVSEPKTAGNGYQNAPMPDADVNAPLPPTPKTAQVSPSLFQPRKQFRGDGYSYGSTAQSWQEQRLKPAPGVTLKVPLD
jgi:hypothetical protein